MCHEGSVRRGDSAVQDAYLLALTQRRREDERTRPQPFAEAEPDEDAMVGEPVGTLPAES